MKVNSSGSSGQYLEINRHILNKNYIITKYNEVNNDEQFFTPIINSLKEV